MANAQVVPSTLLLIVPLYSAFLLRSLLFLGGIFSPIRIQIPHAPDTPFEIQHLARLWAAVAISLFALLSSIGGTLGLAAWTRQTIDFPFIGLNILGAVVSLFLDVLLGVSMLYLFSPCRPIPRLVNVWRLVLFSVIVCATSASIITLALPFHPIFAPILSFLVSVSIVPFPLIHLAQAQARATTPVKITLPVLLVLAQCASVMSAALHVAIVAGGGAVYVGVMTPSHDPSGVPVKKSVLGSARNTTLRNFQVIFLIVAILAIQTSFFLHSDEASSTRSPNAAQTTDATRDLFNLRDPFASPPPLAHLTSYRHSRSGPDLPFPPLPPPPRRPSPIKPKAKTKSAKKKQSAQSLAPLSPTYTSTSTSSFPSPTSPITPGQDPEGHGFRYPPGPCQWVPGMEDAEFDPAEAMLSQILLEALDGKQHVYPLPHEQHQSESTVDLALAPEPQSAEVGSVIANEEGSPPGGSAPSFVLGSAASISGSEGHCEMESLNSVENVGA